MDFVRFEAVILSLHSGSQETKVNARSTNETCDICINVYGNRELSGQVGADLTEHGQYLQHPLLLDHGMEYDNPHYLMAPGSAIDINHLVKHRQWGPASRPLIYTKVMNLLDSLDSVDTTEELPALDNLLTPLLRSVELHRLLKRPCTLLLS